MNPKHHSSCQHHFQCVASLVDLDVVLSALPSLLVCKSVLGWKAKGNTWHPLWGLLPKITSIGEDVEKWEPLCTAAGNVKWCNYVEFVPQKEYTKKTKHRIISWLSNSSSGSVLQRVEGRNSKRYSYIHVHSSIVHSSQQVEAIQVNIHRWLDK